MDEVAGVFTDRRSQRWAMTVLAGVCALSFADGLVRRGDLLATWRARGEAPVETPAVVQAQVAVPAPAAPAYQVAETRPARKPAPQPAAEAPPAAEPEAPAVAEGAAGADAAAVLEAPAVEPALVPADEPAPVPDVAELPEG